MRRIPALLAVLGLSVVGLAGCAAPSTADCPRPAASDPAITDLITVSGPIDEAPEVEVYTPFHTSSTAFADLAEGEGPAITTDSQLVVLDISLTSGESGENLVTTPYDGSLSRAFPLSTWMETLPGLAGTLECASAGSRTVVAIAPGGVAPEAADGLGVGEDDSVVAVIDIRKVFLAAADGAPQFHSERGLPAVVRAPDGRPGIIIPDVEAPDEVVVQTLLEGTGPEVTGDDPIRVNYTGLTWAERAVFDTTWDGEPPSVDLNAMIPGFAQALQGQTVGSQVMVVIPPDQGYGDQEQQGIPAGSTLVFVIDILGIDEAPAP